MKITVIGTGYVGLVTGTCLAETGNEVMCIDNNLAKIEKLQSGIVPIYEPDLDKLLERNIKNNRLFFSLSLQEGLAFADIIFLALPTPSGEDGSADLQYVLQVADEIGKHINSYKIIINKSTVPVGTADLVRQAIAKNYKGEFDVVSNPEFLKEGVAVDDFMRPERIIIGTQSEKAKQILGELYAPYVRQGNPIIFMDERSSELTKYAANSFLATKISFMNEIANLCERVGANVDLVRVGIGSDSRIGNKFLYSGIGYGGSCFPKDVKALIKIGKDNNYDLKILKSVEEVNNAQKLILMQKINTYFNNNLKDKKIAVWGLAFKPNTDDIREAPALYMIDELLKQGAAVSAFDPEAMNNVKELYNDKILFTPDAYQALENADALVICTEWNEFRIPNFEKIKQKLKNWVIFDGRNLFDKNKLKAEQITYFSIGR